MILRVLLGLVLLGLSLRGGTKITVKGIGFDYQNPTNNFVSIGGKECIISAQGVTRYAISCQTTDSGSNSDISSQVIEIQVLSTEGLKRTIAPQKFTYSASDTPYIRDVYPSSSPAGTILRVDAIHRVIDSGDGRTDTGDFKGLWIGSDQCSLMNIQQGSIYYNSFSTLKCQQSEDQEGGRYSIKEHVTAGYAEKLYTMQRTSADGVYFEHTVLPVVSSVNPSQGSKGGQKISIEGSGFSNNRSRVAVAVGGVDCKVTSSSVHRIQCMLGHYEGTGGQLDTNAGSQVDGFVGGIGWKYQRYKRYGFNSLSTFKNAIDGGSIPASYLVEEGIRTSLQMPRESGVYFGEVMKGYFKATTTGTYTFRGVGNDGYALYISNNYGTATINQTPLISGHSTYTQKVNSFVSYKESQNAEIELEGGKYYYMQLYYVNTGTYGSYSWLQIQVEVPNSNTSLRWQTHEVHSFQTEYTYDPEIMNFTLAGVSGGTFTISIIQSSYQKIAELSWNATESQFKSALNRFYQYSSSFDVSVSKSTYDATHTPTDDPAQVYYIEWLVSIGTIRYDSYLSDVFDFNADNLVGDAVWTEQRVQEHSPYISGTFTMSLNGVPLGIYDFYTRNYTNTRIPYSTSVNTLQTILRNATGSPFIRVFGIGDFRTGYRWIIQYIGINDSVELILSNDLLEGGNAKPTIVFKEQRQYSPNLLYRPVDETFLFSASDSPTVHVQVNDVLSISNVSYTFVDTLKVTQQSLAGTTLSVGISNPQNEAYTLEDLTVSVDGTQCSGLAGTLVSFTCDLEQNSDGSPVLGAGRHDVLVDVDGYGEVVHDGTTPIHVQLLLDSIDPNTGTDNGGYEVIVTGNGFPSHLQYVQVQLCNKMAEVTSVTNTEVTFIAPECSSTENMDITVNYNTEQKSGLSFTYTSSISTHSITGISPASSSPVLKKVMTITGSGFGTDKDALSIHLKNSTGRIYGMKILELTDTEIQCGIPGGLPGDFEVDVYLDGFGTIPASPSTANDFTYELLVTDVSPTSGSYYGGTLITITGVNFSPELSETLVFVGDQLNRFCAIQSVSVTQIQCRTAGYHESWGQINTQEITVYNEIIQGSTCSGSCLFTYNAEETSMKITGINDTLVEEGDKILINGANFKIGSPVVALTNTINSQTIEIAPDFVSETEIEMKVPDLQAGVYILRVRLDPIGESNVKILNITSSLLNSYYGISTYGGRVRISGKGFPAEGWANSLFSISTIHNSIDRDVTVVQTSTSTITIQMPAAADSQTSNIKIINPLGDTHYIYVTYQATKTPKLSLSSSTPIASGSSTIVLAKDYIENSSPTTLYIYNVLAPEDLTTVSYTEDGTNLNITTTLTGGKYGFKAWYDSYGWAAISDNLDVTASSAYTASADPSSYLGGVITVTGTDISPAAKIIVDGIQGTLIENNVGTSATFAVPAYITPIVVSQYSDTLSKTKKLQGKIISDGGDNPEYAADDHYGTFYQSHNTECYIGMDLGEGYQSKIKKVKFFPSQDWTIASEYIQGAVIEGSTNGFIYTEIATVDQTVHAGWNSIIPDISTHYRFIRMRHTNDSECMLAEFEVHGLLYPEGNIADINSFQPSNVTFTDGYNSQTFSNVIEYRVDATPVVSDVSPMTGDVFGGYNITITGQYLNIGTAKVMIDGEQCVVQGTPSATQIICQVGARSDSFADQNTFQVTVNGNTAVIEAEFIYVLRWSDDRTWGTDLPPIEGDLVYVPEGMTLYVDESPPKLEGIIVQGGKLIFADEKDMEIHAGLIIVRGGQFRAGTPDAPYEHDLTFVMYGDYYGKQLPEFGNKVIRCFECKFSMYGQVRDTWTTLDATISAGDTSFTVSEDVDWVAGDQIVVASTDFDHNQAEQRQIASISGRTVTVTQAFYYKHVAEQETYGSQTLRMKAEVGLLTRNILMKGDETSIEGEYGSHLMMVGSSEDGLVSHIGYTEFTDCGQPQITDRYCIYFHMNDDVPDSSVKGNAIHHSFARILAIRGTHYLHISDNVGYWVKGNSFFLVDGSETMNVFESNLVIGSIRSWNMLQADIFPASYWITNPTNHLRYNRAAGGDYDAFLYRLKYRAIDEEDICPQGNPMGESHHNIAHSYPNFGLVISTLMPRKYPCKTIKEDPENFNNSDNPSIYSTFSDYTIYKIGDIGLLAQRTANMTFSNFIIAESCYASMQFYQTNGTLASVVVKNTQIIGKTQTNPTEDKTWKDKLAFSHGTIAPRTNDWRMEGITYCNFEGQMVILQTCSRCDSTKFFTNTAKEYELEGISYINVTSKMLKMSGLQREIIRDLDGSFSSVYDGSSRSAATIMRNWPHLSKQSHCAATSNTSKWDSTIICDDTVKVVRVMFTNILPLYNFYFAPMRVRQIGNISEKTSFQTTFYSRMHNREPNDKTYAYALPFILGRVYEGIWSSYWDGSSLDFTHIAIDVQSFQNDSDPGIIFKFNYTENRQLFQIGHYINGSVALPYKTAVSELNVEDCQLGDYYYNLHEERSLSVCLTSRGKTRENEYLDINGIKCRDMCDILDDDEFKKEESPRYWSNPAHWPSGEVPKAGENVTIQGEWTMIVDIQPEPMKFLLVNGGLLFPQGGIDMIFQAETIWIRAGYIEAGSNSSNYDRKLTFKITGNKSDTKYEFPYYNTGNKHFVVTGSLHLYGGSPTTTWTKLAATVAAQDTTIRVTENYGWAVGDEIVIAPSWSDVNEYEKRKIEGITGNIITLNQSLAYSHYGGSTTTIDNNYGTLDMRASVGVLTRNIKIEAGDDEDWGFRLLVLSFTDYKGTDKERVREANIILQGVEFIGGGQPNTKKAAVQLFSLTGQDTNRIIKSTFHNCRSTCLDIKSSHNIEVKNNVFYKGELFHVKAFSVSNYTFSNNLMIAVIQRPTRQTTELAACYGSWNYLSRSKNIFVEDNVCQGSQMYGFAVSYSSCSNIGNNPYWNNTVGSAAVGWIFQRAGWKCLAFSGVKAYGCGIGQIAASPSTEQITFKNFMIADSGRAVTLRFGKEGDDRTAFFEDSWISAVARPSCVECYQSGANNCANISAVRMLTVTVSGQRLPYKFGANFDGVYSDGAFDSKAFLKNVTFHNYKQTYTQLPNCGNNVVFRPHPDANDITGSHNLYNVIASNVDKESWAYFHPSSISSSCGNSSCTGMNNYLIHDYTGDFFGEVGTLIANNSVIGDNAEGCTEIAEINGHLCDRTDIGVLEYESLAPDSQTRVVWPVSLSYDHGNYTTATNAWSSKGSNLLRRGRFVSIVEYGKIYNLTFASEPPKDMRFQLQRSSYEGDNSAFILIKLHFPKPTSIRVQNRGQIIKPLRVVNTNRVKQIDNSTCGSNKQFFENNTIHFVVTGHVDCQVRVSLTKSLRLNARFQMDIEDFFSMDGETLFINRIAALLRITTNRIKIVAVYKGSVEVVAVIEEKQVEDDSRMDNSTGSSEDNSAEIIAEMEEISSTISNMSESEELQNCLSTGTCGEEEPGTNVTQLGTITDFSSVLYIDLDENKNGTDKEIPKEEQEEEKNIFHIGLTMTGAGGLLVVLMLSLGLYSVRRRARVEDQNYDSDEEYSVAKESDGIQKMQYTEYPIWGKKTINTIES